jgi:two-component system CheB/CheR fusion protein
MADRRKSPMKKHAPAKKNVGLRKSGNSKVGAANGSPAPRNFLIVGIGTSAGGLEALEKFFSALPPKPGMAFVLVPHLEPKHATMMPELIQKLTPMRVSLAENGMRIIIDEVYVIPPDKDLSVRARSLFLSSQVKSQGIRMPINHFFRSMADDVKECAVGIVLSGMGSDGTAGLREIKGRLGMVMVQKPESAKFDSMPESAIKTGLADFILPPEQMPAQLIEHARRFADRRPPALPGKSGQADDLRRVVSRLRAVTGHDFSGYKSNTLFRRIERRVTALRLDSIAHYLALLHEKPAEVERLFQEILIGVTSFFRDPESFNLIKEQIFPELFKGKSDGYQARLWVAGCSTGEEAYSLAIIMREYMDLVKKEFSVRIFATDIDAGAVESARAGIYPLSVADDIGEERLKKFFILENNAYRVRRDLREMVIFAVQDVIKDPPFTRLDLVSCRNLLIYLDADLQKKLLPLFHYSLRPGGVLTLGSSETIGSMGYLFSPLDKKWKVFVRRESVAASPVEFPLTRINPLDERPEPKRLTAPAIQEVIEKKLLADFAPPCVVVNEKGSIFFIHGRTGNFLEPSPGRANLNIIEMAREGLRLQLPAALRKAAAGKLEVISRNLRVKTNGDDAIIDLIVKPMHTPESMESLLMVIFETARRAVPLHEEKAKPGRKATSIDDRVADLEKELGQTRENLQSTIEELESANEELKSSNEEYQSTNEELQSANEELETSKEELQSLNEELVTVNAELQSKFEELSHAHTDMKNFLDGIDVPTIFLDRELRVLRFTSQTPRLVNLIDTDLGRPISHIVTNLKYDDLVNDAVRVLKTARFIERELETRDGHWYLARILPYRAADGVIDGVVITFIDIHELKEITDKLHVVEDARAYAQSFITTVRESLVELDENLRVVTANDSFHLAFHLNLKETIGSGIFELGDRQWDIPRLHDLLETILPHRHAVEDFEIVHDFPGIGHRKLMINARRVPRKIEGSETTLLAIEDVTESA